MSMTKKKATPSTALHRVQSGKMCLKIGSVPPVVSARICFMKTENLRSCSVKSNSFYFMQFYQHFSWSSS